MKLAEALFLRADMQKKLASLRERIVVNAVVQEGDQPHEDPQGLIHQAFSILAELETLVSTVNRANLRHELPDGRTLTEAIAARDTLTHRHAIVQAAIRGTRKEPDRYSTREIKWVATLNVSQLHEQSDQLAKEIRELNSMIQETNWMVEVDDV